AGERRVGFCDRKGGYVVCRGAKTGEALWRGPGRMGAHASILNAGGAWLVLTDGGRLVVVKPGDKGYEPVAEYRVSDFGAWAHPVFLGDRILIKDATTLKSFLTGPDAGK